MSGLASTGAAALAAAFFMASVGVAAAKDARQPRPRDYYGVHEQASAAAGPDWRVQYGVVSNPRGASGSLGAMLDGRNPANNLP
ncbi:hypothetical protein [Methylocella sp.]|uniref:hypothetical protein n=1 Tax=Methylocella sp. TaxID=1978226 RepID=UPI00378323CB